MEILIWAVLALIILLAVLAIFIYKKGKTHEPNYYVFFWMGILWAGLGIPLKNYALSAMGIIFLIMGLANKNKWKKNRRPWNKLDKKERKLTQTIMIILGIIILIVLIFLLLIK